MRMPLSPFEIVGGLEHPFSWCARVREKDGAKKEMTYWLSGNLPNHESVVQWFASNCHRVDVLRIERAVKQPTQPLSPVPHHHYQTGALKAFEAQKARLLNPNNNGYKSILHNVPTKTYVPLSQRSRLWL